MLRALAWSTWPMIIIPLLPAARLRAPTVASKDFDDVAWTKIPSPALHRCQEKQS